MDDIKAAMTSGVTASPEGAGARPQRLAALGGEAWRTKQVCCGAKHTLLLTFAGVVWVWGSNEHGQLGFGDDQEDVSKPAVMPGNRFNPQKQQPEPLPTRAARRWIDLNGKQLVVCCCRQKQLSIYVVLRKESLM